MSLGKNRFGGTSRNGERDPRSVERRDCLPAFSLGSDWCLLDDAERTGVTYRQILTTNRLAHFHQWLWQPRRPYSEPARSEERIVSNGKARKHLTHIKDLKNPVQPRPPTRNLSLPIARSEAFDQFIFPGQFPDLPLYSLNPPAVKCAVFVRSRKIRRRVDSHLQPSCRVAYGLTEFVRPCSARSLPKGVTEFGAEYPEVHAILFVGQLVLVAFEPGTPRSRRGWNSPQS